MQGVFVSYRRQDSQSAAGRLSDHLRDHLAGAAIFRDVETIEPGADFVDAIDRALKSCAVLLAVIGPRWLSISDEEGRRRLDQADDYTRLEIATALRRKDVRVIPVLVEGAQMPAPEQLPVDLTELARRNAVELSDKRWDYDVGQLVNTLRKLTGLPEPAPPPMPKPEPGAAPTRRKWWIGATIGILVLAAILADEEGVFDPDPFVPTPTAPDAYYPPPQPSGETTAPSTGLPMLSGMWHDTQGGRFELVQQGNQLYFQGAGPEGYVVGSARLEGYHGQGSHTLNGYLLQSAFVVSTDGSRIDVTVVDPANGQRHAAVLLRQ